MARLGEEHANVMILELQDTIPLILSYVLDTLTQAIDVYIPI